MHYNATDHMDSAHFGFLVISISPGCIFEGNLLRDLKTCSVAVKWVLGVSYFVIYCKLLLLKQYSVEKVNMMEGSIPF